MRLAEKLDWKGLNFHAFVNKEENLCENLEREHGVQRCDTDCH
jgi:hypothetical protein